MKYRILLIPAAALLALLCGGCQHVQPYQRATLTDPVMDPGRDPIATAVAQHVYFTREASFGGGGVGGGGCGCN